MPISAAPGIKTTQLPSPYTALPHSKGESMEKYFDDLRSAQSLVEKYEESSGDYDDADVLKFRGQINRVMKQLKSAISVMNSADGREKVDACLDAYEKALDEGDGKFCREWRRILKTKVGGITFFILFLSFHLGS